MNDGGSGFCDAILLTVRGLELHGWASWQGQSCSVVALQVTIDGRAVNAIAEYFDRPDVRTHLGVTEGLHGYRLVIEDLGIYDGGANAIAITAEVAGVQWSIVVAPVTDDLNLLKWSTEHEFLLRFQNPAFRLKNRAHIAHGAYRATKSYKDRPYILAAAYCVLLYRILDCRPLLARFDVLDEVRQFYDALVDDAGGWYVRWKISLSTALGMQAIRDGDLAAGYRYFAEILNVKDAATRWPQMLCSLLAATLYCGWYLNRTGDRDGALAVASGYQTLFRQAVSVLGFINWHVFDELGSAVNAAQQCAVLLHVCRADPSATLEAPAGNCRVDFTRLNGEWKLLVDARPELINPLGMYADGDKTMGAKSTVKLTRAEAELKYAKLFEEINSGKTTDYAKYLSNDQLEASLERMNDETSGGIGLENYLIHDGR